MSTPVVSVAELHGLLEGPRPPRVLDIRWQLGRGSDRAGYLAGHLPTAVFVDLDAELAGPAGEGGRHPLPDVESLQASWRRAGLNDGDRVVAYDDADGSAAVRAWWLLRWSGFVDAQLLDGGLAAWMAAHPTELEAGDPIVPPGIATVRAGGLPTVDIDQAADWARHGRLLDARTPERYRGDVEPLDQVAGHIPGALNLPYRDLYGTEGLLRPAAELRALLNTSGGPDRALAASCGSGITAGHLVLAGAVIGRDIALFPGRTRSGAPLDGSLRRALR